MAILKWYGSSFVGRRENNEDTILATTLDDKSHLRLFAVADGMGGATEGRLASRLALSAFARSIENFTATNPQTVDLHECLNLGFRMADQEVREAWQNDPALSGMGTTLVALIMRNFDFVIGNIGDSRGYLCASDYCGQVTVDHVAENGSNILTRAITGEGHTWDLFPTNQTDNLASGYGLLLSSDGLVLSNDEILANARSYFQEEVRSLQDTMENLINSAYQNGSSDNISAMMISATEF